MSELPKDGGPATCRKCQTRFEAKAYQIAKADYECPACKRKRQNACNARRDLKTYSKRRNALPHVKDAHRSYAERRKADPEYQLKRAARRKVATEIEAGRLFRQPCEKCGNPKTDAHHTDYRMALAVRWLCRTCHWEEHRAS